MASDAREVNAIFNNPKGLEPQRMSLEKSNELLPSKGNGIESQINHNGYIFNIFFYWINTTINWVCTLLSILLLILVISFSGSY